MPPFSDPRFEKAIESIEDSTTIADVQKALQCLLDPYGLTHAVYYAIKIPGLDVTHQAPVHAYPAEWVAHYTKHRYHEIDPVVRAAQTSLLPIDWDMLDKRSEPVRKLFFEAEEAGIGKRGLSLPIHGTAGDQALLSITANVSKNDWQSAKWLYTRDMQVIGCYLHNKILALKKSSSTEGTKLSTRELECLNWARLGKTIDETSTILGLAFSTVRVYLDNARHKLDCLNKTQAVARAEQLGLLDC